MKKLLIIGLEQNGSSNDYIYKELMLAKIGFDVTLIYDNKIEQLNDVDRQMLNGSIKTIKLDFSSFSSVIEKLINESQVLILNNKNYVFSIRSMLKKYKGRVYGDLSNRPVHFDKMASITDIMYLEKQNHLEEYELIDKKILTQKVNTIFFFDETGSATMYSGKGIENYVSLYSKIEDKELVSAIKKAFLSGLIFGIELSNMPNHFMRWGLIVTDLAIKYRENITTGASESLLRQLYKEYF